MNMDITTLKEKTDLLYQIKQELKQALISKGYTEEEVGNNLSTYPDLIRRLESNAPTGELKIRDGGYIKLHPQNTPEPVDTIKNAIKTTDGGYIKSTDGSYIKFNV